MIGKHSQLILIRSEHLVPSGPDQVNAMIITEHLVTDRGANPNPGPAGWGATMK
jgi:hypothetical protein